MIRRIKIDKVRRKVSRLIAFKAIIVLKNGSSVKCVDAFRIALTYEP